jgi:CMP-N-acetylneuraminic acid synthetase
MDAIAVIPARGGSVGVPRKNLLRIADRWLLGHAIECCIEAVGNAVVISDDREIRSEALRWGAEVVNEPPPIAAGTSQQAIAHALQGRTCDAVAFVQCTSPMLDAADIRGCLDKLPGNDLVICCVPFDGLVLSDAGQVRNFPPNHSPKRQERERQWLISGNCWAFRPSYLHWDWMTGRVAIHEAAFSHRLEIDSPDDVRLAEAVLTHREVPA